MELMPTTCPKCGDRMSTPIPGKRTGLLITVCRNGECLYTERSATPQVAELFKPAPAAADHGRMFLPSTSKPEPPRPRAGAMQRFNQAVVGGTVREAIVKQRQQARAAAAIDPKLHQLPERDR
jgi:hypothetical protein